MRTLFLNLFQRFRRHEAYHFAYDSFVLMAGHGASAFLVVLFHALVGRLMGEVEYALLVALLALLNVLSVPANVISTTMARYVAETVHRADPGTWLQLVRRAITLMTPVGLLALAGWCAATPWLRVLLKSPSAASLALIGVIAFVSLYGPILGGALTGSRRFGWSVAAGLSAAGSRLVLAVPVVLLGGGITGVLGAVTAGTVIGILIAGWPLRALARSTAPERAPLPDARAVSGYFWTVLCSQTALFLLINADMILLPRFLDGEALAAYGKAAQLSRAVFFLPLPMAIAMFPRAVTSGNPRLLLGPALFTLTVCVAAAAGMTLWPALPLRLIYGISGPAYELLIRLYVWAVIPLALINLILPYLWARHAARRTLWLIPVTLGYLLLLQGFHRTPQQMIVCLLIGGLAALAVLGYLTAGLLSAPRPASTGGRPDRQKSDFLSAHET